MSTAVTVVFSDDDEARGFAAVLKQECWNREIVFRHDGEWTHPDNWSQPASVEAVEVVRRDG